jgi:coiled-coil-helix-coiled-coil-helix domain-containing protein 10
MSGLAGMVMQGAAMGTGSAMAHRAVDAVMGPRTVAVEGHASSEAAPAQASAMGPCGAQMKAFSQCLEMSDGDISRCQLVHDALMVCKRGGF